MQEAHIKEKAKKQKTRVAFVVVSVLLCIVLTVGITYILSDMSGGFSGGSDENTSSEVSLDIYEDEAYEIIYTSEYTATHYADIAIENHGTITVALDGSKAPETVENFVNLASSGFYDGLTFH